MEIFRTDGGGRTENPIRLIAVIADVEKTLKQTNFIWSKILAVHDHKGMLKIVLYPDIKDYEIETELKYLFGKAWKKQLENFNDVYILDADDISFAPVEIVEQKQSMSIRNAINLDI